jgi:hypothetical protein
MEPTFDSLLSLDDHFEKKTLHRDGPPCLFAVAPVLPPRAQVRRFVPPAKKTWRKVSITASMTECTLSRSISAAFRASTSTASHRFVTASGAASFRRLDAKRARQSKQASEFPRQKDAADQIRLCTMSEQPIRVRTASNLPSKFIKVYR